MNRTTKFSLGLGGAALLIVALVSHAYYWYAPRARVGSPAVEAPTSQLFFGARDLPLRVWIPFPHQNLAALEHAIGDLEGLSEVSSYLMSQDLAALPSFGPFPPATGQRSRPSRERRTASRIVVGSHRVYPVVAVAGQAGRKAGRQRLARWGTGRAPRQNRGGGVAGRNVASSPGRGCPDRPGATGARSGTDPLPS